MCPNYKWTRLYFFVLFWWENWALLTKRLKQLTCHPPCPGSSHTNLGGKENEILVYCQYIYFFQKENHLTSLCKHLQGCFMNDLPGTRTNICYSCWHFPAILCVRKGQMSGSSGTWSPRSWPGVNRGFNIQNCHAVTECSFPSALWLGKDCFSLLICPPFNFLFIAAYNDT